jgi:hypothetical protein
MRGIQPMTFDDNGVNGSMQYRGQATGQFRLNGSKLSGVTQSSTFKVTSQINGHSFSLLLPKVRPGTAAPETVSQAASIQRVSATAPRRRGIEAARLGPNAGGPA